jgi:hypothetical protein
MFEPPGISPDLPGIDDLALHRSLARLSEHGLIEGAVSVARARTVWTNIRVTGQGMRALGEWPDLDQVSIAIGMQRILGILADGPGLDDVGPFDHAPSRRVRRTVRGRERSGRRNRIGCGGRWRVVTSLWEEQGLPTLLALRRAEEEAGHDLSLIQFDGHGSATSALAVDVDDPHLLHVMLALEDLGYISVGNQSAVLSGRHAALMNVAVTGRGLPC